MKINWFPLLLIIFRYDSRLGSAYIIIHFIPALSFIVVDARLISKTSAIFCFCKLNASQVRIPINGINIAIYIPASYSFVHLLYCTDS
ncbi:hypothetical protein V1511DRAFT_501034 [Dipodascopsis uninucleata]